MKTVVVLMLLIAVPLASAAPKKAEPEPTSTDLAQAFQPAWQNDKARLFRVTMAPSQATPALTHDHDWLLITLSPGNVTLAPEKARSRRVEFQPGHIEISTSASPTIIRNSGNAEATYYLLELSAGVRDEASLCGLGGQECESEYGNMSGPTYARSVSFETPTLRAIETTIDPGATVDPHEHPYPYLLFAVSGLELQDKMQDKPAQPLTIKAGDFQAFQPGLSDSLTNIGKAPARLLTLEIK
jgi:quercetin dioxygenase-like cupin family protein